MPAALSVIEIDPRGRLVESLPGDNDDLKFDDRQPPRWKFIYNNFGGLLRFFPTLGLDLSLDFSLSRILDLHHGLRFVVYRSESTQVGVTSSYGYGFGRKITAARLSQAIGFSLGVARIDPSFGQAVGAGSNPGTLLTRRRAGATTIGCSCGSRWKALSLGAGRRRRRDHPRQRPGAVAGHRLRRLGVDRAARRRTRPGDVVRQRASPSAI